MFTDNAAAYLICLCEIEREQTHSEKIQTFVDLGCGNGLLVNILTSEGNVDKILQLISRIFRVWSGSK